MTPDPCLDVVDLNTAATKLAELSIQLDMALASGGNQVEFVRSRIKALAARLVALTSSQAGPRAVAG